MEPNDVQETVWPKKSIGHAEKDFLLSLETQNPERGMGLFLIIHMIWATSEVLIKC